MCVDLHLHSTYSDGTCTPEELVLTAARHDLRAISLTDHDTVEGICETIQLAARHNLTFISGIELNTTHRGYALHILGYGIDHADREFRNRLSRVQAGRKKRNDRILGKLQSLGISLSQAELESVSGRGQVGRPHFARILVEKGIVGSMGEAFNRYLGKGAPAWTDRFSYTTAESIDMIHRAGGVAVFAHPGQLDPTFRFLPLLIHELVERGLDGIEAYYPSYPYSTQKRLLQIANKYKLVVTGGSDYHGNNRGFSSMAGTSGNFCPPASLIMPLEERMNKNLNNLT